MKITDLTNGLRKLGKTLIIADPAMTFFENSMFNLQYSLFLPGTPHHQSYSLTTTHIHDLQTGRPTNARLLMRQTMLLKVSSAGIGVHSEFHEVSVKSIMVDFSRAPD